MRMLGFDTAMSDSHMAREVLSIALEEKRTIITRNTVLANMKMARDVVLLTEDDPWEQLRTVLEAKGLEIDRKRVLTRCLEDNEPLVEIDKYDIRGEVWPYVWETQDYFTTCPRCGRIFWPASHVEAMLEKLRSLGLLKEEDNE